MLKYKKKHAAFLEVALMESDGVCPVMMGRRNTGGVTTALLCIGDGARLGQRCADHSSAIEHGTDATSGGTLISLQ